MRNALLCSFAVRGKGLVICLLAIVAIASGVHAQTQITAGTIQGTVVDANGAGILRVQSAEAVGAFDQAGITIERAGGAATPNLNALVFAGALK